MTLYTQTMQKDGRSTMGLKPEDGVSSYDRSEIVRNIIATIERKHRNMDDETLEALEDELMRGRCINVDTMTYDIRESEDE